MSTTVIDRRVAALLVSLLLAGGVAAAPARPTPVAAQTHAQTHALQTHA